MNSLLLETINDLKVCRVVEPLVDEEGETRYCSSAVFLWVMMLEFRVPCLHFHFPPFQKMPKLPIDLTLPSSSFSLAKYISERRDRAEKSIVDPSSSIDFPPPGFACFTSRKLDAKVNDNVGQVPTGSALRRVA